MNSAAKSIRSTAVMALSFLVGKFFESPASANPTGGTVSQGAASFSKLGSQLTINTSANTFINWQSFNIGLGETTTFVEPSATAVVWNRINDPNPSRILGTLNANGYVILENSSGFYVGGSAAINAAGLVMTTAHGTAPTLGGSDAWTFTTPPPTAAIINYGQINISGGGPAYLIANDIENNGTIFAPGGKIGLYAGEQVLVSLSPDGRGVSAAVTLPQGSVDNAGHLIADGGFIAAQAQTVNQSGTVEADTVQNDNGVVELVASGNLTLGPNSDLEAHGDAGVANTTASPGGMVVLQAGGKYTDTATSIVNVAGQNGGQNGLLEAFGSNLTDASSLASQMGSSYALLVNPFDVTVSANSTAQSRDANNNNLEVNLNAGDLANYTQIDVHALDNLELSTAWTLNDSARPAILSLQAGNSLILDAGASISGGKNWEVNLTAGTGFVPTLAQPTPPAGDPAAGDYEDGIYLKGGAYVQTQNGDLNVWAANEVQIDAGLDAGNDGIRTLNGGNINVTAVAGEVNTGGNPQGFLYHYNAPFITPTPVLGGISTVAGGNVTINAGGDVISYLPTDSTAAADGGTGTFGSEPGNVVITAGGNVYGHYVLADGTGSITAGGSVGTPTEAFALSLMDGVWNVSAPNGNIYLQEVRNPNGDFNNSKPIRGVSSPGYLLFDYAPEAAVNLTAGDGVYLTDQDVPRLPSIPVQVIYPPILNITAGAGGVTLQDNVTLFPSADQNLSITTRAGGSLVSSPNTPGAIPELLMSDSSNIRWNPNATIIPFSDADTGTGLPAQAGNPDPVVLNIAGNLENLNLITAKATQLTVGGDMTDCGFSGQNLHASDITSINVAGQIYNQGFYAFVDNVTIPTLPVTDLLPGMGSSWNDIFTLAVNPAALANLTIPANLPASQWASYALTAASVFNVSYQNGQYVVGNAPNFVYDPATSQLGYSGPMNPFVLSALGTPGQPITILQLVNGQPVKGPNGQLLTTTVTWASPAALATLYTESLGSSDQATDTASLGYRLGGPGEFNVAASSISLGSSSGILSCGVTDPNGGFNRYQNLAEITSSGATVNVIVSGDLNMQSSTIAALGGGDVNVTSTGGAMDLGSQALANPFRQVGLGIFTSGGGEVNVTALGDINIDGSRIATFNGGNINIESEQGTVNVGSGGDTYDGVYVSYVDPKTGQPGYYPESVYGSGILANTLVLPPAGESLPPGAAAVPGNITVQTPRGNIVATLGGITQEALDGNISAGPTVTLNAGTFPSGTINTPDYLPGYIGNIDLGQSGVIGGTVNVTANGNISGLIISRQESTVVAAQNFNGSVISAGSAHVSGASVEGVIVGVGDVSVSGDSANAEILGQNVSVNGGAAQSTLGSSASATSTSQSAANQSDTQAKQQLAISNDDFDDDKKKKKHQPVLQRAKRVTVILPNRT